MTPSVPPPDPPPGPTPDPPPVRTRPAPETPAEPVEGTGTGLAREVGVLPDGRRITFYHLPVRQTSR